MEGFEQRPISSPEEEAKEGLFSDELLEDDLELGEDLEELPI